MTFLVAAAARAKSVLGQEGPASWGIVGGGVQARAQAQPTHARSDLRAVSAFFLSAQSGW